MSMKRDVAKKEIRLRASRFLGTSMAVSLTVSNNNRRRIYKEIRVIYFVTEIFSHTNQCHNLS